jgi:RNA polymerase sigma factor (sigma-70 family)
MSKPGSVTQLAKAVKHRDHEAAQKLWTLYVPRLLALARRNLNRRIWLREDPQDIVQSVFKSFFHRAEEHQFDLESRGELWNLLLTITLRKVRNTAVRHRLKRRDYRVEKRNPPPASDTSAFDWEIPLNDPTPEDAAIFNEEFERLLNLLSKPELRKIALMNFEGRTNGEIAKELGCTERSVERKVARIRTEWEEALYWKLPHDADSRGLHGRIRHN